VKGLAAIQRHRWRQMLSDTWYFGLFLSQNPSNSVTKQAKTCISAHQPTQAQKNRNLLLRLGLG
jgi:hypothetical protein